MYAPSSSRIPKRSASPSVAIRDTSAAGVLTQGKLRIRVSGTPGRRLRLIATAVGGGRHGHSITLTKPVKVTLSRGGRAKASLPLTGGGRAPLRAAVALCHNQKVSVKAVASHERALGSATLRGGHGCHHIPTPITHPPGTPPPKGSQAAHFRVGAATVDEDLKALALGGRIVTCGSTSGPKVTLLWPRVFFKHADILGSTMGNSGEFEEVLELVGAGLKPVVDSVYPLAEVEQALAHLDAAEQFGKVVLRVAE